MKKLINFLLLLVAVSMTAQSPNDIIEKQFMDYSKLVIDRNVEKALDYTNPEIFKMIPRDQMKSLMEMVYKMPSVEYKAYMPSVSNFEPVVTIDNKNYVRFTSHTKIEMRFISDDKETDGKPDEQKETLILNSLIHRFGVGNVVYDPTTKYYSIKSDKKVVASSDKDMKDWKFAVVDNPNMKKLLESFIPKALLD